MYAHLFGEGHQGLDDVIVIVIVMVIVMTDVSKLVDREGFWAYKMN